MAAGIRPLGRAAERGRIDRLGALCSSALGAARLAVARWRRCSCFKANRIAAGEPHAPLGGAAALARLRAPAPAGRDRRDRRRCRRQRAPSVSSPPPGPGRRWRWRPATAPAGCHPDRQQRSPACRPAPGFWLLLLALALLVTDALARLRLGAAGPGRGALRRGGGGRRPCCSLRAPGTICRSCANTPSRADSFWQRGRPARRCWPSGSLAAAVLVGLPLGILVPSRAGAARAVLQILNIDPDDPEHRAVRHPDGAARAISPPHVPLAAALGIRGIGAAPALLALFLYSLLPVVANTVVGLGQVLGRRRRRGARHGHDRPAAPDQGRVAAGASGHPHRHPHRAGAEHRPCHRRGPDRRRRLRHLRLPGHRPDRHGPRAARRRADRGPGLRRGRLLDAIIDLSQEGARA